MWVAMLAMIFTLWIRRPSPKDPPDDANPSHPQPLAAGRNPLPPGTTVEHFTQEPNLAIFGCLVAAGRNPFP